MIAIDSCYVIKMLEVTSAFVKMLYALLSSKRRKIVRAGMAIVSTNTTTILQTEASKIPLPNPPNLRPHVETALSRFTELPAVPHPLEMEMALPLLPLTSPKLAPKMKPHPGEIVLIPVMLFLWKR